MSISQILFSFQGRIGRQTFWITYIGLWVVSIIISGVLGSVGGNQQAAGVVLVVLLVVYVMFIWVGLAIQAKRWHDRDKSGWWILINVIPFIGLIWALVELGFLKGTTGPNRFGEDPLVIGPNV